MRRLNNLTTTSTQETRINIPPYGMFSPLRTPGGIIFIEQFGRRLCVPAVACAALMFDLRQTVFNDAVTTAEDWAAGVNFIEARPERRGVGVFDDYSVEAIRERWIGLRD